MRQHDSRATAIAKNLLAMLVGLTLTLGLLEGAVRVMASTLGVSPYMQYDETLGWTALPNTTKRHRNGSPAFDVSYELNAYGHRGPTYARTKPAGTRRIVLLGDSVGFGWGVDEGQHLAALLDTGLDTPTGKTEVINLSLSGYGTDQQLLRLRSEGLAFQPDLVILQLTPNDFDEIQYAFYNQKPKPHFVLGTNGSLELRNSPVRSEGPQALDFAANSIPLPFREWLGWHSYAYNLLNEQYYRVSRSYRRGGVRPYDRFRPESVALFNRLVQEIKVTLDERHIPLLVVHAAKEISDRQPLRNPGIPLLDLSGTFAAWEQTHDEPAMFSDGFHWAPRGHHIVADAVMEALRTRGDLLTTVRVQESAAPPTGRPAS